MDEDDRDNDQDEVMEDADEPENDPDPDPDPDPEEDDEDAEDYDDAEAEAEADPTARTSGLVGTASSSQEKRSPVRGSGTDGGDGDNSNAAADGTAVDAPEIMDNAAAATSARNSATPGAASTPLLASTLHFKTRPEALTARLYDIVPTMAAPQATSINALAVTPDLRYWMTGGSDGYIRKYDGPGTINGRQLLTVAQRHPFVDSVVKAGILMSYWENEEPPSNPARSTEEHILSPVYSLAVHSRALWLLAGTEGGGINLQSVRHDEGKRITCLQRHTNAVSVLQLAPNEKSVLSGSWDKNIFDWDLNTGQVSRQFDGSGGQISVIELRPASGAPIPARGLEEEPVKDTDRTTLASSNNKPIPNGVASVAAATGLNSAVDGDVPASAASATISGDDLIPDHESLFGSPGGSLFGESDAIGANPFGDDDMGMTSGSAAIGEDVGSFSQDADMVLDSGGTTNDVFAPAGALSESPKNAIVAGGVLTKEESTDGTMAPVSSVVPLAGGDSVANADSDILRPGPATRGDALQDDTTTSIPALSVKQEQEQRDQEDKKLQQSADTQFLETGAVQVASVNSIRGQAASPTQRLKTVGDQEGPQPAATVYSSQASPVQFDPTQVSETTFFSASMDGTIRIWDRRQSSPVARIGNRLGVPPWCMGACWSPDGNRIYAGRRNGIVEEFDIHKAKAGWQPERSLRFPAGSGPVSAVRAMVNGRHLVCASHDILRLYDLQDTSTFRHSHVPFLIIPGPPRAGVISHLYIDQSSRFMISTAGTRGWEGTSTEVLIGYEISSITK